MRLTFAFIAVPVLIVSLVAAQEKPAKATAKPAKASTPAESKEPRHAVALLLRLTGIDVTQCPRCRQGTMQVVAGLPSLKETEAGILVPSVADSS